MRTAPRYLGPVYMRCKGPMDKRHTQDAAPRWHAKASEILAPQPRGSETPRPHYKRTNGPTDQSSASRWHAPAPLASGPESSRPRRAPPGGPVDTATPRQASTPGTHSSPAYISIRIVPPDGIRPFNFNLPLSNLGEQVLALTCERTQLPADVIWISLRGRPILMSLSLRDLGAQDASVLQVSVRAAGGTRPMLLPSQWDTPRWKIHRHGVTVRWIWLPQR